MIGIQRMIDQLSMRAAESDLIALLATSRQARRYNADMARQLYEVVAVLQQELDRRHAMAHSHLVPTTDTTSNPRVPANDRLH